MGYPTRRTKVRTRGIRGHFYSQKLGRDVYYESLNEKYLLKILETSPFVASYCEQPLQLQYEFNGKVGTYTPDVLATHIGQSKTLFEAKSQEELDKNDDRLNAKLLSASSYCEENGWEFVVVTEAIKQSDDYLRAVTIWPHLMHPGLNDKKISELLQRFEDEGSIKLSDLCPGINWHDDNYSYVLHLIGLGKLCESPYGEFGQNTVVEYLGE